MYTIKQLFRERENRACMEMTGMYKADEHKKKISVD